MNDKNIKNRSNIRKANIPTMNFAAAVSSHVLYALCLQSLLPMSRDSLHLSARKEKKINFYFCILEHNCMVPCEVTKKKKKNLKKER